jgi:hypothetical protein
MACTGLDRKGAERNKTIAAIKSENFIISSLENVSLSV